MPHPLSAFQISHSRQTSLVDRNLDVFHRLLDRSDPVILSYLYKTKKNRRNKENFPDDVKKLCKDSEQIRQICQ